LQEKKLDDSLRLDVVEVVRVPNMLLSLFPSSSGLGLISTMGARAHTHTYMHTVRYARMNV